MRLAELRLAGVGGFDDLVLPFEGAGGVPRPLTVIFGGDGVGKTSVLGAIATTRPGHAIAQTAREGGAPAAVVADWFLGEDDPARPHPLRVTSPNVKLEGERDEAALMRRREQAAFDRRATEGGFAFVAISGARWFSRTGALLTTPERTLLRYDVRAPASFDDATRADLTREVKQVLTYVATAAALERARAGATEGGLRFGALAAALAEVLAVLLSETGVRWSGVDPTRIEPVFEVFGREVGFDDVPRGLRHRIAIGALAVRALAAAFPGLSPREAEGVALVDDLEAQQDLRSQRALPALLRRALPRVQWIVTTASPAVTLECEIDEVLALRRAPATGRVELHRGAGAALH